MNVSYHSYLLLQSVWDTSVQMGEAVCERPGQMFSILDYWHFLYTFIIYVYFCTAQNLSKCVWLRVNLRLLLIFSILLWWKIGWSASLSTYRMRQNWTYKYDVQVHRYLHQSVELESFFFTAELYAKETMI